MREHSESFDDHFGQARLFWNSVTAVEKMYIINALQFELSLVDEMKVKERMIQQLGKIHPLIEREVGRGMGLRDAEPLQLEELEDATAETSASGGLQKTSGLSQEEGQPQTPKTRKVAIIVVDGTSKEDVEMIKEKLKAEGATFEIVGPRFGELKGGTKPTKVLASSDSPKYDAVILPGGVDGAQEMMGKPKVQLYISEAFMHGKPVAAINEAVEVAKAAQMGKAIDGNAPDKGVFLSDDGNAEETVDAFVQGLAKHRFRNRDDAKVAA